MAIHPGDAAGGIWAAMTVCALHTERRSMSSCTMRSAKLWRMADHTPGPRPCAGRRRVPPAVLEAELERSGRSRTASLRLCLAAVAMMGVVSHQHSLRGTSAQGFSRCRPDIRRRASQPPGSTLSSSRPSTETCLALAVMASCATQPRSAVGASWDPQPSRAVRRRRWFTRTPARANMCVPVWCGTKGKCGLVSVRPVLST